MNKILVGIVVTTAVLASGYASAAETPNWNGFYVGANVGGGWSSNRNVSYSPNDPASINFFGLVMGAPPTASFNSSGALGGLQFGYNWQFNRNWLAGLETDFDWSGIRGSGSSGGVLNVGNPFVATVDEQIKWFGTVRARLGYLPTNSLLTYITGGFAYGRADHTGNWINNGAPIGSHSGGFGVSCGGSGTTCFAGSSNSAVPGWTAGAGLEYAFPQNITVRIEYLYVSLGGKSLTETAVVPFPGALPTSFNANYGSASFSVARVGLNYRFW